MTFKPDTPRQRPFRAIAAAAWAALSILAALSVFAIWYFLIRDNSLAVEDKRPPKVQLEQADPAVAKAITSARQQVLDLPRSDQAWGQLAMTLLAHGFNEPASFCFTQAAAYNDREPRWPYLHARAIVKQSPEQAVRLMRKAADLCGDDPDAPRLRLSELLIELDRFDEAETHLSGILKKNPVHARAQLAMGRLFFRQGDLQKSLEHLRRAEWDETARRAAGMLIAEIYRRQGKLQEAEDKRKDASTMAQRPWHDPYFEEVALLQTGLYAQLDKANQLLRGNDPKQALEILHRLVDEYPKSFWARNRLGRTLLSAGNYAQATAVLEEALLMDPDSIDTLFRLGLSEFKQKQYPKAAQWFRQAIAQKPDFTLAYYNLGFCLVELNDPDAAIRAYESAIQTDPNFVDGFGALGNLLVTLGRTEQARDVLQHALELDPLDVDVKELLDKIPKAGSTDRP